MNTHNISFCGEIRKDIMWIPRLIWSNGVFRDAQTESIQSVQGLPCPLVDSLDTTIVIYSKDLYQIVQLH